MAVARRPPESDTVPLLQPSPQGVLRCGRHCQQIMRVSDQTCGSPILPAAANRRRCRQPPPPPAAAAPSNQRRSHLMLDGNDPQVADKFSMSRLRRSMHGRRPVPSSVHGAPLVRQPCGTPPASFWGRVACPAAWTCLETVRKIQGTCRYAVVCGATTASLVSPAHCTLRPDSGWLPTMRSAGCRRDAADAGAAEAHGGVRGPGLRPSGGCSGRCAAWTLPCTLCLARCCAGAHVQRVCAGRCCALAGWMSLVAGLLL